jgi:hypothetical protein
MSIALSLGNNITTSGIFKAAAVTNTSVGNVTTFAGITGSGTLELLSTQTASSSATISFTTGLDSTYDEYIFKFINIAQTAGERIFQFNGSTDGGSNYNVTKTSTFFRAQHTESDSTEFAYQTGNDLAQGTGFQDLIANLNSDADSSCSGTLTLFAPSSTTFVKHFIANVHAVGNSVQSANNFSGGYFNTTSAINAIQFKMDSSNFDGVIKLYGVVKS